jgi:hypothetical protein
MSTLPIRASYRAEAFTLPRFAGIISFMTAVFDVFADADELAQAAYRRYPLIAE